MNFDEAVWVAILTLFVMIVTGGATQYWERRKLSRDLRAQAYAGFIETQSRWWRVSRERDQIWDELSELNDPDEFDLDAPAIKTLSEKLSDIRDELWEKYSLMQVVASPAMVQSAFTMIKALDLHNANFFQFDENGKKLPRLGEDERASLLAVFTSKARQDLGLRRLGKLHGFDFRSPSSNSLSSVYRQPRGASWVQVETVLEHDQNLYSRTRLKFRK